ncbi:hypothetical protein [Bordetella sp. N]|uniref:hypothetical protein n=1 Tax=Bordetella sp. N TaxID=1746199 RepID=UPI00070CB0F4|nr:hypothetical protein [Bordetella sp. N]ALM82072.1 hypothetical protein ASB57_03005 [Bordetella sp. N]
MEVFAKNSNGWGATLLVDPAENGKFHWRIQVEDRRRAPASLRYIYSPDSFPSVGESIDDGRAVLESLTPDDLN